MPQPMPPSFRLGVVEPKDAIRAFEARNLLLPSFRWQDVWQEEHQRGFAVAGVMRADVLAVFREALDAKFATGGTLDDFKKAVRPALVDKGFWGDVEVKDPTTGEVRTTKFNDSRLRLIFDVNVRQSYLAAKWKRFQATKAQFPFVIYKTMEDTRVRPAHAAWDNLVLPIDDPFWQTHWPMNGWRCRCDVQQVDKRAIDRLEADGRQLKRTSPSEEPRLYTNPYTGEIKAVPRGVDPGFGINPGIDYSDRDAALAETVLQKAIRADAFAGAVVAGQAATDMPALLAARSKKFAEWVSRAQASARRDGDTFVVGTLRPEIVRALDTAEIRVSNAGLIVRALDVPFVAREVAGQGADGAAALRLFEQLPTLLHRPDAVLQLLGKDARLVYVIKVARGDGKATDLFVEVEPNASEIVDGASIGPSMNTVRSVSETAPAELRDSARYRVVWGSWEAS